MAQKRETEAINKLCVREILSLSFVYGACFFEFRGRSLVCFDIAYKFHACALRFSRVPQLVEHRTGIAEVTGSNPVEDLIFFRLLLSNGLDWKIYCDYYSLHSNSSL